MSDQKPFTLTYPNYPDEAFANAPVQKWPCFETGVGCTFGTPVWLRPKQYSQLSLTTDQKGLLSTTRLQYTLSSLVLPSLSLRGPFIRHAFTNISFRVTNHSAKPIHLMMDMNELPWENKPVFTGKNLRFDQSHIIEPGQSTKVQFDWDKLRLVNNNQPTDVVCPLTGMTLLIPGGEVGVDYKIEFSDLQVTYPKASAPAVKSWQADPRVRAGEPWQFGLAFDSPPVSEPMQMEWCQGGCVYWRHELGAEQVIQLHRGEQISVTPPTWLPQGTLEATLTKGGYWLPGLTMMVRVENKRRPGLAKCQRKQLGGRPWAFANGQPIHWQAYSSYDYQPGPVRQFGERGHGLFFIPVAVGMHLHHVAEATVPTPGQMEMAQIHERVGYSLQSNPDAHILFRCSLTPPPWWVQQHADQQALVEINGELVPWEETNTSAVSIASESWVRDQMQWLKQFIESCDLMPWADRVIGFMLHAEVTEEWFAWGSNDGGLADYSKPFQGAWVVWKQQNEWDDLPDQIATPELRRKGGMDFQPDSLEGRWVAATDQFMSDLTTSIIIKFSKAVKKFSRGRSLTGTFIGYVIQLTGETRQSTSGHFGLQKLLQCPDVDVIAGVPLLDGRGYLDGAIVTGTADASVAASGKLILMENDLFSWLHPGLWHQPYDVSDPRQAAIDMHQRVGAMTAIQAFAEHKFSLMSSWHHDSILLDEFGKLSDVNRRCRELDRTPMAEVAFVVDDRSLSQSVIDTGWWGACHKRLLIEISRCGAPVDVWLLSDLAKLPKAIKFVVLASAVCPDVSSLQAIKALLKRRGIRVLAVGPIGLVDVRSGHWVPQQVSKLLELQINVGADVAKEVGLRLRADGRLVASVPMVRPRLESQDAGALIYSDGVAASCERKLPGGGKLTWVGVPPIDAELLRGWMTEAGVHLYAPAGYQVRRVKQLLSVTASVAGEVTLQMPALARLQDLYSDWQGSGKAVVIPFRAGQTRLMMVR